MSQGTTHRDQRVLPCTTATARGMATAFVAGLILSRTTAAFLLLGLLVSGTAFLDGHFPGGALATGVVYLAVLGAQLWLGAVNAARLRAAPGTILTSFYRDGAWVVSGNDGEDIFGPGSVRVRRLGGATLLRRPRRPAIPVPDALVTDADADFLTRPGPAAEVSADPWSAAGGPRVPGAIRLGVGDLDRLVRAAQRTYLRRAGLGYLVGGAVVLAVTNLLHRRLGPWWLALFAYLCILGWIAVGRATRTASPIGSELHVSVSDDALTVTTPTSRRVVRYADVRSLAVHHDVLLMRRRGVPDVMVPVGALPQDALPQMRAAFAALGS